MWGSFLPFPPPKYNSYLETQTNQSDSKIEKMGLCQNDTTPL